MEFVLIKQDSPEWAFIWNWLEKHPINKGLEEPRVAENNGAEWEYIGSYKQDDRILHEFRHLCHPTTQGAIKTSVAASSNLTQEQIAKEFRIK